MYCGVRYMAPLSSVVLNKVVNSAPDTSDNTHEVKHFNGLGFSSFYFDGERTHYMENGHFKCDFVST